MNVVDSSGWLEYFADAANADFFAPAIEAPSELFVPSISLYEVFKRVLQQRDETAALEAVAVMQSGRVIDLDAMIAINSAGLAHKYKLPMADSIILATAIQFEAELWTQDADFKDVSNVHYVEKK